MDYFVDDYPPQTDPNVLKFCEIVVLWKKQNQQFFPEDILNYLIQMNIVKLEEVVKLLEESNKKQVDIKLPVVYI